MTKSEIIEARERLEKALETIKKWLPCVDSNLMVYVMIPPALEDMNRELKPLLTHIMDNDDYNLAIKINKDITPVWNDYSDNVNSKRLEASEATWEVNTLIKRLRKWKKEYEEEHPQQPDTPTANPSAKDDGNSYITNDKILKALPDLYDCLVDDGAVSKDYIKKEDFSTCITKANIPQLKQGKSEWIKKTTKFKGFIKCIRHCFNDDWYSAICKSADLTDKEMGKYNTDNTADFEVTIKAKLKQNGIG